MQFEIWTKGLADLPVDCVAVGVHDDGELAAEAKALDLRGREKLSRLLKRGDFTAKAGETWLSPTSKASAPNACCWWAWARRPPLPGT